MEYAVIAGYAFGVYVFAMVTEAFKALIWVAVFLAFYRRLPKRK